MTDDEAKDAARVLREHEARNRNDLDVREQTLVTLLRGGKPRDAVAEITAVVTDGAHGPQYHYDLIARLANKHRLGDSLRVALDEATRGKSAVVAWYALGLLSQALEHTEQAVEQYDKAITADSKFAEAYFNLGNAYNTLGQKDRALQLMEKSVQLKSSLAEPYFVLGALLMGLGRHQEAIDRLQDFVERADQYLAPYVANARQLQKVLLIKGDLGR